MDECGYDSGGTDLCGEPVRDAPQRNCHKLKIPKPANHVSEQYFIRVNELRTRYHEMKWTEAPISEPEPSADPPAQTSAWARSFAQTGVRTGHKKGSKKEIEDYLGLMTRIQRMKEVCKTDTVPMPFHLVPKQGHSVGTGRNAQQAISWLFSKHAVATSYTAKSKPTHQSGQQTTRFPIDCVLSGEIASQMATEITFALCGLSGDGLADTGCDLAGRPVELWRNQSRISSSAASAVCADMPRFIQQTDLVANVRRLARAEVDFGTLTEALNPQTAHVRQVCAELCSDNASGFHIWLAWALVFALYDDARSRRLLDAHGITDFDVAVASSMLNYGRGAVSNRSRRESLTATPDVEKLAELCEAGVIKGAERAWQADALDLEQMPANASIDDCCTALNVHLKRNLSKKSKRKQMSTNNDGAYDFLAFVFCAKKLQNSVMLHLASSDDGAALRAARGVLDWQIAQKDFDVEEFHHKAAKESETEARVSHATDEAVRALHACVASLVTQDADQSPVGVVWTARGGRTRRGIARSRAALMAGRVVSALADPPAALCPPNRWCRVLWATHSAVLNSLRSEVPLCKLKSSTRKLPSSVTGLCRSVLLFRVSVPVTPAMRAAAQALTVALEEKGDRVVEFEGIRTPSAPASGPLAVGMLMQESLRALMLAPSNKITTEWSVRLSPDSPDEDKRYGKAPTTLGLRPNELLLVADLKLDTDPEIARSAPLLPNGSQLEEIDLICKATVVGDSAIPVETAIDAMLTMRFSRRPKRDEIFETAQDISINARIKRARALVFAAVTQCTSLHTASNAFAQCENATSISRTSRLGDPDNTRLLFPTLAQAFVVAHNGLRTSQNNSAWCGTYGAGYASGVIAAPGRLGCNLCSDRRLPTTTYADQAQVDELTEQMAEFAFAFDARRRRFARIPYEQRGIPRRLTAGVHSALRPLEAAFRMLRREGAPTSTVDSVQVLPFSPFSENVPARVADPTWTRLGGEPGLFEAHQSQRPDSTLPELSVLHTPFFDAMRVRIMTDADNSFETIDENIASCFVLGSALANLARIAARSRLVGVEATAKAGPPGDASTDLIREAMSLLVELGDRFYGTGCETPEDAALFCDMSVVLALLYPKTLVVGELLLPRFHEKSSQCCLTQQARSARDVRDRSGVAPDEASALWARYKRAWAELTDFVCVCYVDGRNFALRCAEKRAISRTIERFVRSVWLVFGDDPSHPTHGRRGVDYVRAGDVLGVFVSGDAVEPTRRKHRCAAVGVKGGAILQAMTCLQGASIGGGRDVRVQVAQNEGGMLLRISSCALVANGRKSASPVGIDNDELSFGTLEAKREQATAQIEAYTHNNAIIFHTTKYISLPTRERLFDGLWTEQKQLYDQVHTTRVQLHAPTTDELEGDKAFEAAIQWSAVLGKRPRE